jgi:hypothetical protein
MSYKWATPSRNCMQERMGCHCDEQVWPCLEHGILTDSDSYLNGTYLNVQYTRLRVLRLSEINLTFTPVAGNSSLTKKRQNMIKCSGWSTTIWTPGCEEGYLDIEGWAIGSNCSLTIYWMGETYFLTCQVRAHLPYRVYVSTKQKIPVESWT